LFTNEATFTTHENLNLHNMHYWAVENPRWLRQVEHFIDGTLTGERCEHFLRNTFGTFIRKCTTKRSPSNVVTTLRMPSTLCSESKKDIR
ncbi:hypothetical protein WH47_12602, partial [Habropoda laboriosa]